MSKSSVPRPVAASFLVAALSAFTLSACGSTPAKTDASTTPAPSASATPAAWGYDTGLLPDEWGTAYPECADAVDRTESPIDIAVGSLGAADPADPVQLSFTNTSWRVFNNGHTVEAVPVTADGATGEGLAGSFTIAGTTYTVVQFHLHSPSEHTFDGATTSLEMHVVGSSADGKTAVIGVPLEIGSQNAALVPVFAAAPKAVTAEEEGVVADGELNLADVLPVGQEVVRYTGSLTTPPCTGGVLWDVYTTPVTISSEEASAFTELYTGNARPVQPLHGRELTVHTVVAE